MNDQSPAPPVGVVAFACRLCAKTKPRDAFYTRTNGNRRSECRECANAGTAANYRSDPVNKLIHRDNSRRSYLKKYGLSEDDFANMMRAQGGLCAICSKPSSESRYGRLSVDHCHATGAVRGLLCSLCNLAIGYFRDDPTLFAKAHRYVSA